MKARVIAGTVVVLFLVAGLSCDPSGPDIITALQGLCEGEGDVHLDIPVTVFCEVERITAVISGPDMDPINIVIDKNSPKLSTTIPSGPNRHLSLVVETIGGDIPVEWDFCVPDNRPVVISVNITMGNNAPTIRSITPSGGPVDHGSTVKLEASAFDRDECDRISYKWAVTAGTIKGNGRTATWVPDCPTPITWTYGSTPCGDAVVSLAVSDNRSADEGGRKTSKTSETFNVNCNVGTGGGSCP
jgi:hypothetical protein